MRIHIRHATTYTYDQPAKAVIQLLRLTPRACEGQSVRRWRIDLDVDGSLRQSEDAFGNVTHMLSLAGPIARLTVAADGEVETMETDGVVRGAVERFPTGLYLRETALTRPSAELAAFARDATAGRGDPLTVLHALMLAVHRAIAFDTRPTQATTTAAEAFRIGSGVCQDLTHVFIAAARVLGIPARYVGGYLWRADGALRQVQDAGHAWAEAHTPNLGWVGFDPANAICSTAAHVRVAVGLDYLGAAPVRGSRTGGPDERLDVALSVTQAAAARQD
ncbi:MAG: transglutaminase family protein [Rhodospirillaceae bacterium]|nr:transglutaminase family protein [Rhodospirillaceae bacterium]